LRSAIAKPCIVASPMRTPVNEPGPRVTARRSIALRSMAFSASNQSIAGNNFSLREPRPSSAIAPISVPPLINATERIGRDVSAARTIIRVLEFSSRQVVEEVVEQALDDSSTCRLDDYFIAGICKSTSSIPIFAAVSLDRSSR
jgi:hypothetical protein